MRFFFWHGELIRIVDENELSLLIENFSLIRWNANTDYFSTTPSG